MSFKVIEKACDTCIYRADSPLDLEKLENQVRDQYVGFRSYRVCHESKSACCRGFWNRHKDQFSVGASGPTIKRCCIRRQTAIAKAKGE